MPVFGVDLDDVADGAYRSVMVQHPAPYEDLAAYVLRNAGAASGERDEEVDARRELAMAARLKTLLERYRKVLFTGGLAHWLKIRSSSGMRGFAPALYPNRHQKRCTNSGA